jgi:hypothetical protein
MPEEDCMTRKKRLLSGLMAVTLCGLVTGGCSNPSGGGDQEPPPPVPLPAPDAPAIAEGDSQLTASWAGVEGATFYEVYYGTGTDPASANRFDGDADATDTEAVITGLANGTTYYLWVKAKNDSSSSGFSPAASGRPKPSTVQISILGWTNDDQAIFGSGMESPLVLSKSGANSNPAALTVTVNAAYTVTEWQFNGEPRPETGATFTVNASGLEYASGVIHRLGVRALKDGIQYSTDIRFTVVD